MTCAARLVSFAKIAYANECCVALLEEAGGERAAKAVNTPAAKYTQVQKHRVTRAMVTYETVANAAISGNAVQLSDPQGCAAAQRPQETRVHQTQAASDGCIVQQRAADADSKSDAEASDVPVGRWAIGQAVIKEDSETQESD